MAKRKNKKVEQIDPAQLDTYFKERMYQLGIADTGAHGFEIESLEFHGVFAFQPIFTEDSRGNIEIHYPSLYGGAECIAGTETEFMRLRYKKENQPDPDRKYFQPPKSGLHIFHTPGVIQKFQQKAQIDTLFVIEGEFKAFAGYLQGLDIVGLGGKDLFVDEEKKTLHPDLLHIISTCGVINLVLLLDADVDELTWDAENDPDKDLAKRLNSFCKTVKKFREMAKGQYQVKDVYYTRINARYLEKTKGLDDLLFAHRETGEEKKVIEDLLKLKSARTWFDCENISELTPYKIQGLFFLNMLKGVPASFYFQYEPIIKKHEFTFNGGRYKYTDEGLQLIRHAESFKYVRIGCDYFKMISVPNSKGIMQRKLEPWKAGEITRDYINRGLKNFFDTIDRYDSFCNVPNNNGSYQQVINGCFNMYYPLNHELQAGEWPNIATFLKHIFGEKVLVSGHTNYELALDYITILYRNPTQRLPIPALVNRKKNTGKSTFLWLLEALFQDNYTQIGNDELKDHLNDDWASKLVIGIDEGFIEKKTTLERIKSMSTGHTIKLRGMYAGRKTISFFGKFVIASNDEDNFAPIDDDETRFWVNKVPVLTEDDPKMLDKMKSEVSAFLSYLKDRQILHPDVSRHWFHYDLIDTEAGQAVKRNSKGWAYSELSVILQEKFIHYAYPTLFYTIGELEVLLNSRNSAVKFRAADINKQLNEKFKLFSRLQRYEFPNEPESQNEIAKTYKKKQPQRVFEFRVENFFTEQEMRDELAELFNYDAIILSRGKAVEVVTDDVLPF